MAHRNLPRPALLSLDAQSSIARLGTSDDETVDQHAVNPGQKSGLRARTIYWERRARISSWPGCNSSPLARGRIHLRNWNRLLRRRDPLHGRGGPYIFCKKLAKCGCIQHLFGQQLLQPRVLVLKRLQPLRLGDLHAAVFGFPIIKRRFSNSVLAAEVGHLRASLLLLQHRNNLLFRKSLLLHSSVL